MNVTVICVGIALLAILAGLVAYRIDQVKRERGESDSSGEPWNWEGWL